MKKLGYALLFAFVTVFAVCIYGDDWGGMIVATPNAAYFTSETAIVYRFFSATTPPESARPDLGSTAADWAATSTQWFSGGTSNLLHRTVVLNWIMLENLTSYTITYAFNINETTPTLSSSGFEFQLLPPTTGYQSKVIYRRADDLPVFNGVIRNVGIFIMSNGTAKTTATLGVTTPTLRIVGR